VEPKRQLELAEVRVNRAYREVAKAKQAMTIKGQQNLYEQTDAERIARVDKAVKRLATAEMEKAKARAIYVEWKREVDEANAELKISSGLDGLQLRIDNALAEMRDKDTVITSAETSQTLSDRRRKRVEEGAIRALTAAGGKLTNKELAALLGVDAHGLSGLLSKCEQIERFHDGNIQNESMSYKLKEKK
jgi:hypothetical protein